MTKTARLSPDFRENKKEIPSPEIETRFFHLFLLIQYW